MHVTPAVILPPIFGDEPSAVRDSPPVYIDTPAVNVPSTITVKIATDDTPFVDQTQHESWVADWDSYVGQLRVKDEIQTYIDAAFCTMERLPHVLLASGMPGVGKTTLARLIAKEMGVVIKTIVAPFTLQALQEAILSMRDGEILFIDEIHRMAENGPRMAENLLTVMEEGIMFVNGERTQVADFTVVAATTDADKLPETILDRFMVKPIFDPYSVSDMVRIVKNFTNGMDFVLSAHVMVAIAKASRATPRIARELIEGAKARQIALGRDISAQELLEFKGFEPNGIMRNHKRYLVAILDNGGRPTRHGYQYAAGENTLCSVLRENKPGIHRIERHLLDLGYVRLLGQGRTLTELGEYAARQYKREGI